MGERKEKKRNLLQDRKKAKKMVKRLRHRIEGAEVGKIDVEISVDMD